MRTTHRVSTPTLFSHVQREHNERIVSTQGSSCAVQVEPGGALDVNTSVAVVQLRHNISQSAMVTVGGYGLTCASAFG